MFRSVSRGTSPQHPAPGVQRAMTSRTVALLLMVVVTGGGLLLAKRQQPPPSCTGLTNSTYPLGAVITHDARFYRCLTVLDSHMTPAGLRWIQVEKSGTRWVTPRNAH